MARFPNGPYSFGYGTSQEIDKNIFTKMNSYQCQSALNEV